MSLVYSRPPIHEAVIEFRYAGLGSQEAVQTAAKRLHKAYPHSQDIRPVMFSFDGSTPRVAPGAAADVTRKMTSPDGTDVVMLHSDRIARSRLAPYDGWDSFVGRFHEALKKASAITRKRKLTRIGVRYINRIDVPTDADGGFDHSRYISVGLDMPFEHGPVGGMAFSVSAVLQDGRFGFVLQGSKAPSPLIGHAALVLDIEVYNQVDLPSTEDGIWAQVDEIRTWKNRIFESSLRDEARELFK